MANTAKKFNPSDESATMQVVKNDAEENTAPNQPAPDVKIPPVLTIEQKMQKVSDLNLLIDKYQKLTDARKNLQSFKLGSDGMNIQVKLMDRATGTDFSTSHSSVVQVVISDMQRILEEKICEVERQIEF